MYLNYFGLARAPYRITPDTELFYGGAERGDILEALAYAIVSGEAITKVVGEVGTGKTMLCRMLEHKLPDSVEIVYLANPSLPPENVLHAIAFELGLAVSAEDNRLHVMKSLEDYLLQRHAEDRQVVVFVEEAQGMPLATLEEIRLLSNLETQHHKLLQVVLFGQPELDEGLKDPSVRQIKERITNSFYLAPLHCSEIQDYLAFRLHLAGFRGASVFSSAATWLIARFSGGLMRRINIIADKSLLAAFSSGSKAVTIAHVWAAIRDCEFVRPNFWIRPAAIAGSFMAIVVALGMWMPAMTGVEPIKAAAASVPQEQIVQTSKQVAMEKVSAPVAQPPVRELREDILQYRLDETQRWISGASPGHFTIQVFWAQPDKEWALERFLREAEQSDAVDQLFVYRAGGNETGPLNVVYGDFSSYAQASAAMASLPELMQRNQPFLRNVRGVVAEASVSNRNKAG